MGGKERSREAFTNRDARVCLYSSLLLTPLVRSPFGRQWGLEETTVCVMPKTTKSVDKAGWFGEQETGCRTGQTIPCHPRWCLRSDARLQRKEIGQQESKRDRIDAKRTYLPTTLATLLA